MTWPPSTPTARRRSAGSLLRLLGRDDIADVVDPAPGPTEPALVSGPWWTQTAPTRLSVGSGLHARRVLREWHFHPEVAVRYRDDVSQPPDVRAEARRALDMGVLVVSDCGLAAAEMR